MEPHRDERTSASPWFSPGLVRDDEIILRTILDPHHVENNTLSPAAIALADLRERGWSVDRKTFTSAWRIRLDHKRWGKRKSDLRKCWVVPAAVGDVRKLIADDQKLFVITDHASPLNPAHGSLLLATKSSQGAARKARDILLRALPSYISLEHCFTPQEKYGWWRGVLLGYSASVRQLWQLMFS